MLDPTRLLRTPSELSGWEDSASDASGASYGGASALSAAAAPPPPPPLPASLADFQAAPLGLGCGPCTGDGSGEDLLLSGMPQLPSALVQEHSGLVSLSGLLGLPSPGLPPPPLFYSLAPGRLPAAQAPPVAPPAAPAQPAVGERATSVDWRAFLA